MPELPEVETYARDLAPLLAGRIFRGAWCDWPAQLPRNTPAELGERIRGQRVRQLGRRGKYLAIRLDDDWLLVHLKMSGRLVLAPGAQPADRHVHTILLLDDGAELRLRDPRKFGRVYLVADPTSVLGPLGPEPLAADFTRQRLQCCLRRRRGRLKSLLLNQSVIAGIGNICADESLWLARLHPLRTADSLTADETARLHRAIRTVLRRAVAARGTTLADGGFRDLTGNPGEMQGTLNVFRRTGQPCPRCGEAVVRIRVGGRGTHLCPACQPAGQSRHGPLSGLPARRRSRQPSIPGQPARRAVAPAARRGERRWTGS